MELPFCSASADSYPFCRLPVTASRLHQNAVPSAKQKPRRIPAGLYFNRYKQVRQALPYRALFAFFSRAITTHAMIAIAATITMGDMVDSLPVWGSAGAAAAVYCA